MLQKKRTVFYVLLLSILCIGFFLLAKNAGTKFSKDGFGLLEEEIMEGFVDVIEKVEEPSFVTNTITGKLGAETETEILLVNKDNPLPENYEVELLKLPDGANYAAKEAYEPLCNMLEAGRKEGLNFEICSSYRDADYQKKLFEEDVETLMRNGYSHQDAYEETAEETMPPGCSEHSTGLAFDIVALEYQALNNKQENTEENQWLQEHCAEYGFILRYPKGKEEITSINYESWHFRYVGVEAAEYIMEQGITLEEYLRE